MFRTTTSYHILRIMEYSWASITKSCINFGNIQIEYGLKKALRMANFNEDPSFQFDAFKKQGLNTVSQINKTKFLIVPGCTTLVIAHYPGLRDVLPKIRVPIVNFGAALSQDYYTENDRRYYKYYKQPIGARDPFTDQYLRNCGLKSVLIGCPTLFSGSAKKFKFKKESKKLNFIFGTRQIEEQIKIVNFLIPRFEVTVIIQQANQLKLLENTKKIRVVKYNPKNLEKEFNQSRALVTGRLHGALPALSFGLPVFFLDTRDDTRFSLLDYLCIKRFSLKDPLIQEKMLGQILDFNYCDVKTFKKIDVLKEEFLKYIKDSLGALS